jgi:hypothetical protein
MKKQSDNSNQNKRRDKNINYQSQVIVYNKNTKQIVDTKGTQHPQSTM